MSARGDALQFDRTSGMLLLTFSPAFATLNAVCRPLTTVSVETELLWSFLGVFSPFLTQSTHPHFQNPLLCSVSSTLYLSCHALKVLAESIPKSLSHLPLIPGLRTR